MMYAGIFLSIILSIMAPRCVLATDFSAIFEKNMDSVVTIKSGKNLGTGFYVTENFIATNMHVIMGSPDISFCTSYKNGFVKVNYVVATDSAHDLAIIYAEKPGPPVTLAQASDLVPGMELVSIGSPQGYEKTFASGNFSQMRQNGLLQISIPVSPGSSGSPVFDAMGRVVGVVVAQRKEAQNLNFAIPSEDVIALMRKADLIPKIEYKELANFYSENKKRLSVANEHAIASDYINIDTSLTDCKGYSSTFFESPRNGPIKKCICNDVLIYTNLLCQCPACRK